MGDWGVPLASLIVQSILGFKESGRQSALNQEQVTLLKEQNRKTKLFNDMLEMGFGQVDKLPQEMQNQARIAIGQMALSGGRQQNDTQGTNISGGGWAPGLPQQIAQQQGGIGGIQGGVNPQQQGGLNPLMMRAAIKGGLDIDPGNPYTLRGLDGSQFGYNGPVSVTFDPVSMKPIQIMPESVTPQRVDVATPGGGTSPAFVNPYGQSNTQIKSPGLGIRTKLDIADTPIPDADLAEYVHPDTLETPPSGSTPRQLAALGFKRLTTNARTMVDSFKGVAAVAQRIQALMQEVYPQQGGLMERMAGGFQRYVGAKLQTFPQATELDSLIRGTLAPTIRALGEKGTLNEGDTKRALALMPVMTDSADVAWRKVKQLNELFATIQTSMVGGIYKSKTSGINLKPGIKKEDPLGLRK
jgi:hypothetical protein